MFDKVDERMILLSEIQGEIFEESVDMGLDSREFIRMFMNGNTAWHLDLPLHKASWCGKGYISEEFHRENDVPHGKPWNWDLMYWIGYVYRFWHYMTGQSSKAIYKIGTPDMMMRVFPRAQCMPAEEAVRLVMRESGLPATF